MDTHILTLYRPTQKYSVRERWSVRLTGRLVQPLELCGQCTKPLGDERVEGTKENPNPHPG